jgi:hypothetical protein
LDNSAAPNAYSDGGGGMCNGGTLTLSNSTVSDNSAANGRGGGIANYSGQPTLTSSILAGNTAPTGPNCYASVTSGGYNLLGIGDGCGLTNGVNGDQVGTGSSPLDPRLVPL